MTRLPQALFEHHQSAQAKRHIFFSFFKSLFKKRFVSLHLLHCYLFRRFSSSSLYFTPDRVRLADSSVTLADISI